MSAWLRFGGGNELLNELLKNCNCIGFAAGNTGAQMGGWFRRSSRPSTTSRVSSSGWVDLRGQSSPSLAWCRSSWPAAIYPALEKGTNPIALQRLVASGGILRPYPEPIMEACYSAAIAVYNRHSQTNPLFKKLYDSVPFRGVSYQWMQVAELSYDAFMMGMRTRT